MQQPLGDPDHPPIGKPSFHFVPTYSVEAPKTQVQDNSSLHRPVIIGFTALICAGICDYMSVLEARLTRPIPPAPSAMKDPSAPRADSTALRQSPAPTEELGHAITPETSKSRVITTSSPRFDIMQILGPSGQKSSR